jgi:peptide/nickel transport system substrate-binding protein
MDQRDQGVTMTAVHVQTGLNNRFTRLRRCLLSALLALPLPAIAAAPQTCGTVIVPPGVGLGTPPASVASLNPLLIGSTYDGEAVSLLYEGLLFVNSKHQIDYSRSIASGVVVSADDTTFTVTMKPWNWSDGKPVTAADVKYTYDLIKKLGPTYPNYGAGGIPGAIKSFTVLISHQFEVVTTHPVNPIWFELVGLAQLTPYPQHVWGRYSINQMWRRQSDPAFFKVVDGPFRLVRFALGRHIVFGPNPTYQGHRARIHRFIMTFLHSAGSEIEGMRSGSIDLSNLPFSLWKAGHELKNVRIVRTPPNFGFDYMQLNYKNPKVSFFKDVKVRQAIADSLNEKAKIKLLFHNTTNVQHGPVPVDPPTFLSPAAKAGQYPVGFNPAKARKLLNEAGWKMGPDGIRRKDGRKLSFTYLASSGGATAMLSHELTQQSLRAIGIEMKIRQVTFNQLLALSNRPLAWEAMGFGWSLGSYPSDGAQLRTGGSYNQAGYSDRKMDRLLDAVTTTPGMDALYKYQDYAAEQQPEIFEEEPGVVVLANPHLRGVRKFLSGGAWAANYLYFDKQSCTAQLADDTTP